MIKKYKKNLFIIESEFFDLYLNDMHNVLNEINEERENEENNKNNPKFRGLDKEIEYLNSLIENTNQKLLSIQKEVKDEKSLYLTNKDISQLNDDNNRNKNYIAVKSEGGIKIEFSHINDPKNIIAQKKSDMNLGKLQYNEEYLNLCSFSNRLYITSNNNISPINIINFEQKNNIKNEKERLNSFHIQNENENSLNNNDFINFNNKENKSDINFEFFKNNNNIDNKFKKDSLIFDSFCGGSFSFNPEMNNIFNNGII